MNLIDRTLYIAVRKFFRLLGKLPRRWTRQWAVVLGSLFFRIDVVHRKIAIENLTQAYAGEKTPDQIRAITRQVFINMLHMVFEVSAATHWSDRQLARHISIHGLQDLRRAAEKGKGVLLLGAHFGNWELQPMVAHLAEMPLGIVYRTLDAPALDQFFKDIRSRHGAHLIPNSQGAMRKIYKALRQGRAVGLLMDQGVDFDDGVFVDFFNRRAASNIGMAVLAVKTKTPVIPFFLIRRPDGFQAVFGPELPLIQTGDHTKDIEENTQLYNHVIEAYIRRFPDQWFWVHQRWKNLPFCPWPRTNPRVSNRY